MPDRTIAEKFMSATRELKPVVIWLSGRPGQGKTTLARILECSGMTVFKTDEWLNNLPSWCPDAAVAQKITEFGPGAIGECVDHHCLPEFDRSDDFAKWFLDPNHGFTPGRFITLIEGYMHSKIQLSVVRKLEAEGTRVWMAINIRDLETFATKSNWR